MGLANEVEVAVVGAGAAGIGAARVLAEAGVEGLLLEARARIGGRAHTVIAGEGLALDLGCGWLHSGDVNPWTGLAEAQGRVIDKAPPPWMKQAFDVNFSAAEQRDYRAAFQALDERLEAAAAGPDRPASALLEPGCRWNPLLDAFSGYYNGAPFDQISVQDYGAYEDTGTNWRIPDGYGTAVAAHGAGLPLALDAPVSRIDRRGPRLRLHTPRGVVEAGRVIVCTPTAVLADERLRFDPPLTGKAEAAAALPLGHVDKAFLGVAQPEAFPVDTHLFGRIDTARTASYHLRPFGRPVIEGFFGGDLAGELEREGEGAFAAFAIDELVSLLGSSMRRQLRPLAASNWGTDPWSGGAYSHAAPGQAGARARLAEPVEDRIHFAGEACSAHAFSTAHGALQTGIAAAQAVLRAMGR